MHLFGVLFFIVLAVLLIKALVETVIGLFQTATGLTMWAVAIPLGLLGKIVSIIGRMWSRHTRRKRAMRQWQIAGLIRC